MNANQGRPRPSDQTRNEAIRQQQIGVSQAQREMQANRAPKVPPTSDEAEPVEEPETEPVEGKHSLVGQ